MASLGRCGFCGTLSRPDVCAAHGQAVTTWACAVCGVRVCSVCRRGTRHAALCETHADVRLLEGWAEVGRGSDEVAADVAAERIRLSGLEARVISQKDHVNVVGFGGLSIVRILVPAFQFERSRAILAQGGEHDSEVTA